MQQYDDLVRRLSGIFGLPQFLDYAYGLVEIYLDLAELELLQVRAVILEDFLVLFNF